MFVLIEKPCPKKQWKQSHPRYYWDRESWRAEERDRECGVMGLINEAAEPAAHGDSPDERKRIQLGKPQKIPETGLKTLETLGDEEDDGGA
ncbi:hypothetical protein L3X38_035098 [Prunus dulcis]|uniref:Uncharacterized protein n=1 Tax=Prunus dulcis TaxID=3755 RepID=A0AAD4VJ22_PRUDU|nr:hypothetical protein L3X38_035098 [Prunus dulcis]